MGGGKPLRPWGEARLIDNAVAFARRQAPEIAVALRTPGQAGRIEAKIVLDAPDVEGPLAGLAAALGRARELGCDVVVTLPCDMPLLPHDLGDRLIAALQADPRALAAVARAGADLHPVCAAWRIQALERLPAYLATGNRSLRGFAELCGAATAAWPQRTRSLFANVNTPDELAELARQAA